MKRQITLGLIGWLMATIGGYKTMAQDTPVPPPPPAEKKETQEITIRKKGDKDTKITVEITGDKVLLNGKPLAEFNEEGVTVNNRKVIIRDGNRMMLDLDGKMMDLDLKLKELDGLKNFNFNFDDKNMNWNSEGGSYTYMGITTNKIDDGLEITNVTKGSPAEKAGLQNGDIIYKLDDTKVETTAKLSEYVRAKKEGDKVKVYYLRNGKKKDQKVELATMKNSSVRSYSFSGPDGAMRQFTIPNAPSAPRINFGDGFNNDTRIYTRRQKLGLRIQDTEEGTGVKVIDVEASSPAATAGLMKDDIVTEIGGKKVSNTDDAREQLQENAEKNTYSIKAKRNGTEMSFEVKIPKKLKTTSL